MTKNKQLFLLSILGGLILALSWPMNGIAVLLFFGFIPFLIIEDNIYNNPKSYGSFAVLRYTFIGFLVWNVATTYWIVFSTVPGAIIVIITNSLLMSAVWQIFHFVKKRLLNPDVYKSSYKGYLILILFWLSFEYLHLNWELAWGWLHVGNGLVNLNKIIQWYEYTGVMGGTLWVLIVNILLFVLLKIIPQKTVASSQKYKFSIITILFVIIPILFSLKIFHNYNEEYNPVSVVVVQPNIDPHNTKFNKDYIEKIWETNFTLSKKKLDTNVKFLLLPETSIPGMHRVSQFNYTNAYIRIQKNLIEAFPNLTIVMGANTYEVYDHKATYTARVLKSGECCIDIFNSALEIDKTGLANYYHKAKLVPGVEKMPYPKYLSFLEKFAVDLGGIKGSLGSSTEPVVFNSTGIGIAPIICYESIFGEYITQFVNKGANLIFIMTNDGWWRNTAGYKQHHSYARLRAIETRRSIARSANTGISSFINQKGQITQQLDWWQSGSMIQELNANSKITFYVRNGDFLGRISTFSAAIILLIALVRLIVNKKSNHKTFD